MPMTTYGQGAVFRRGNTWWVRYWKNGQRIRESSQSAVRAEAVRLLGHRLATASPPPMGETFETLADAFMVDQVLNKRRAADRAERSVRNLARFFTGCKADRIKTAAIRKYQASRSAEGAANATINRELAALRRMFTLAVQDERLPKVPHVPMLAEDNVRKGFLSREHLAAVVAALPRDVGFLVEVAFHTAWRKSELLSRDWAHVDLGQIGSVRLEPGETKNGRGREFPLVEPLQSIVRARHGEKLAIEKRSGQIIQPLFFQADGSRITEHRLRYQWKKACHAAQLGDRLFHDLRRSGIRNMIRAGIPQTVAKKLSGHITDSVFERYAIVDETDLREQAGKLAALDVPQDRHNTATT